MDDPLPFEEGGRKPRTRNKRRSSILKLPSAAPLQDLDLNVKAPESAAAKAKSRRVSFSRSNQIKEFQTGSQTLTIWNDTYEKDDDSQNQSAQKQQQQQRAASQQQQQRGGGGVLRPGGLPAQQRGRIIAGQTTSVSPSKKNPLQITIPPKTDSPKKFLPTQPVVDTTNFLKSLGESEPEVNSGAFLQSLGGASGGGDEGVNESVDQENSFLEMLNKLEPKAKTAVNTKENRGKPRGEVLASQSRTVVGQVDMSRTMMGEDLDLSEEEGDDSMVDTGGFLAALAAPSTNATVYDGGMDVTGALSMTCVDGGAEVTCHDGGMNMTCRDGGMEMTCRDGGMEMTCRDGGMEMTCRDGGMGLNMTCREENSLLDITCPDKNESTNFDNYKNMDITSDSVFGADQNNVDPAVEDYHQTLAKKLEPELPESEGSSRNSSFDGGATATMPFSGLMLANNTLLLPRKESEEDDDDMTKVPIQIINYDPLRPVEGLRGSRGLSGNKSNPRSIMANQVEKKEFPADMEITKVDRTRIGSTDMDMTGEGQDAAVSGVDMEMTRAGGQNVDMEMTRAGGQNVAASEVDMEMTRAGGKNIAVSGVDMEMTRAGGINIAASGVDMEMTRAGGKNVDMEMTRAGEQNVAASGVDMEMTRAGGINIAVSGVDMQMTRAGGQNATLVQRPEIMQSAAVHSNRTQLGSVQMELTRADQQSTDMNVTKPQRSMDMDLTKSMHQPGTRISSTGIELTLAKTKMCSVDMELTKAEGPIMTEFAPIEAANEDPVEIPQFNISDVDLTEAVPIDLVPQAVGDITSFIPKGEYESTRRIDFPIPKHVEVKLPVETATNNCPDIELTEVLPRQVFPQDIGDITSFVPKGECESTRRVDLFIPKPVEQDPVIPRPAQKEIFKPIPVQEPEDDDLDMDNSMMAEFQQRVQESKEEEMINLTRPASADMELTRNQPHFNNCPVISNNEPMEQESVQGGSSKSSTPGRDVTGAFKADYCPPALVTPDHELQKVVEDPASSRQSRSSAGDLLRARFPSPTPDDISPERTEMLGPMQRFNKSVFQGDITSFTPRDTYESTRCVGDLLPKAVLDVTSFAPKNDYESTRRIQDLVPQPIGDITSFMPKGQCESTRRVDAIIPMAYRDAKKSDDDDIDVMDILAVDSKETEEVATDSSSHGKMGVSQQLAGIKPLAKKNELSQTADDSLQRPAETKSNEVIQAAQLTLPIEVTNQIEITQPHETKQAMELTQTVEVTQPREISQPLAMVEVSRPHEVPQPLQQPEDVEFSPVTGTKITSIESEVDQMDNYSSPKRFLNDKEDLENSPKRTKLNNTNGKPNQSMESTNLKMNQSSPDSQEEIRRIIASCKVSDVEESVHKVDQSQNKTASIKERLRGLSHSFVNGQERNEKMDGTETGNDEMIENIDASSAMELTRINKTNAALQITRADITRVPTPEVDMTKVTSLEGDITEATSPVSVPQASHTLSRLHGQQMYQLSSKEESLGTEPDVRTSISAPEPISHTVHPDELARMCSKDDSEDSRIQKSQNAHSELCLSSSVISPLRGPSEGSSLSAALMTTNFSNTSSSVSAPREASQVSSLSSSEEVLAAPSQSIFNDDAVSSLPSYKATTQRETVSNSSFATIQNLEMPSNSDEEVIANSVSEACSNTPPLSSQLTESDTSTSAAPLPSQVTNNSCDDSIPRIPSMDSNSTNHPPKPTVDLDDLEISFRSLTAEAQNLSSQFKNLSQGHVEIDSLEKTDTHKFREESIQNISSNPSNLISEELCSKQTVVETSMSRKRQATEPHSEEVEAAKSPKTDIVAMEYPVDRQNEHNPQAMENQAPIMTIHPPSPLSRQSRPDANAISQKVVKRQKSPPRLPEVTIFQDLVAKKVPKMAEDEEDNDWRFEMHDEESKTAIFSWMNRSIFLVLHLGARLEAKKTRKSIGKLVIHFPITKIYLDTVRNINGQEFPSKIVSDPNRDLAQFTILRKFTPVALHSLCPNTCSLSSVLKKISQYVTPANQFMDALDTVDDNHFPFKITNNVVTVGFVSTLLDQAFDLAVDFSGGFSSATERVTVKAVIGEPNVAFIEKVAKTASPGPVFIQEVAAKIGQYLKETEMKIQRKQ